MDPYRAGKCPKCGVFATSTQRHIGAPVFCRNGHSWKRPVVINEGIIKKGGVNNEPQSERPPDPKGQSSEIEIKISIKDVGIVKDLIDLTRYIINELEEEGCFPATIKKYREKLNELLDK